MAGNSSSIYTARGDLVKITGRLSYLLTSSISRLRQMARLASIFSGKSPQYLIQLSWKTINSRNPQHDERKTASVNQFLQTV